MGIRYKTGYKCQLHDTYVVRINIVGTITTQYIDLTSDGLLTIRAGYAWDGPSWPAVDTPAFRRGALVHDALYQMIREGYLDEAQRSVADGLLRDMCIEDGMSRIRAWWVYNAVRMFGGAAADPQSGRPILEAP